MKKFAALIAVAVLSAAARAAPADQIKEQVVVETASAPVGTASAPAADASAATVSAPVAR